MNKEYVEWVDKAIWSLCLVKHVSKVFYYIKKY